MSDDDSSSSSSSSSSNDDFLVAKSTSKNTSTSKVDDDDEADNSLQINTKYAKEYESRKRREELTNYRQLKVLEGVSDSDDDDSSDSESEDEDAELLTADMGVKIIKTLRALKQKDEGIYDKNVTFFEEGEDSDESEGASGKDRVKKMRYKDVVREHILEEIEADEKGSTLKDDGPRKADGRDLAYDVEQREIRKAFLESTKEDNPDGSESEEEDWLKPKAKTVETDEDQAQVRKLWEEEFASSNNASSISKLVDPKGEVQDPDKFLMDFISNRKWVDTTDTALRKLREVDEESVESFQDKMDDFESKYNFRFEEAAASSAGNEESGASHSIVHYARGSVGDNVLRRKDETRRQKRLSRKERKAEERKAKEEQLRRLKNAKREELEERMQQVRNVLGYDVLNDANEKHHALGAAEEEMILKLMEGEYDPDKFEQVMNAAYGEDYYQQEDDKWKTDQDVKSDLAKGVEDSDIVGGGDMYDEVNEEVDDEDAYPADADGNEDEAYNDEEAQWEEDQYENSGMEKKLKSKMMDELYKLDYEDIIGDMPTRFKYRQVEPNSYGLSTTEILMANDTSLKQFVSLKKMAPYRDEVSSNALMNNVHGNMLTYHFYDSRANINQAPKSVSALDRCSSQTEKRWGNLRRLLKTMLL
jgi:protein KRI1